MCWCLSYLLDCSLRQRNTQQARKMDEDPPKTHSHVLVPVMLAAMGVVHPGIPAMRQDFGDDAFDGAVSEVRMVLPRLASRPRIEFRGPIPYVSPIDQEAILELAFNTYLDTGHFQQIQTVVALRQLRSKLATTGTTTTRSNTGANCCDAPRDVTCKTTGLAHVQAKCVTCNGVINARQPYCSKEKPGSMVKCSAAAHPPVRSFMLPSMSPFGEVSHATQSALHDMQSDAEFKRKKIAYDAMVSELLGSIGSGTPAPPPIDPTTTKASTSSTGEDPPPPPESDQNPAKVAKKN